MPYARASGTGIWHGHLAGPRVATNHMHVPRTYSGGRKLEGDHRTGGALWDIHDEACGCCRRLGLVVALGAVVLVHGSAFPLRWPRYVPSGCYCTVCGIDYVPRLPSRVAGPLQHLAVGHIYRVSYSITVMSNEQITEI